MKFLPEIEINSSIQLTESSEFAILKTDNINEDVKIEEKKIETANLKENIIIPIKEQPKPEKKEEKPKELPKSEKKEEKPKFEKREEVFKELLKSDKKEEKPKELPKIEEKPKELPKIEVKHEKIEEKPKEEKKEPEVKSEKESDPEIVEHGKRKGKKKQKHAKVE